MKEKSSIKAKELLRLVTNGLSRIVEEYYEQIDNIPQLVKDYKDRAENNCISDIYDNVLNSDAYYKRKRNPDLWTTSEITDLFKYINHPFDTSQYIFLINNLKSIIQLSDLNYRHIINELNINQDKYFRRINNPELFSREEITRLVKLIENSY